MKVDIEPKIKAADDFFKVVLEFRPVNALYVFITKDGTHMSVEFDEKGLENFLPKMTVSEAKKMWEDGFQRQIDLYKKAVKNKQHPYWTVHREITEQKPWMAEPRGTGKFVDVPAELTRAQAEFFKSEIKRIEDTQLGEIDFVKICYGEKNGQEVNGQGFTLKELTLAINKAMETSGLPYSKYKKKYFYSPWTQDEVLSRWFYSHKTVEQIIEGIAQGFENAWAG